MSPRSLSKLGVLFAFLSNRKRPIASALLALFTAVIIAACWLLYQSEPRHNGTTAGPWLDIWQQEPKREMDVVHAFQAMGTPGAQYLMQTINGKPPEWQVWLRQRERMIPGPLRQSLIPPVRQLPATDLLMLLAQMGTNAQPIIPQLQQWMMTDMDRKPSAIPATRIRLEFDDPFAHMTAASSAKTANVIDPITIARPVRFHVPGASGYPLHQVKSATAIVAIYTLARIGGNDPHLISTLLDAMPSGATPQILFSTNQHNLLPAALQALPALSAAVQHQDDNVRLAAVALLSTCLPHTERAIAPLISAINDPCRLTSDMAVTALSQSASRMDLIMPALVAALTNCYAWPNGLTFPHNSEGVLPAALKLQADHGAPVEAELRRVLETADSEGALAILRCLKHLKVANNSLLPRLQELTKTPSFSTRSKTWTTIWELTGDQRARAMQMASLLEGDARMEGNTIKALGQMGTNAAPAVPQLARLVSGQDMRIAALAAEALGKIGPAAFEAAPALEQATKHPYRTVQEAAAEALKKILGSP